ncbi:CRISPR system Cascade subunit CasA [Actinopolyspora lacussalsi]|nr:CRISPR system Cascade subunit CasA [Actinopolyspora lacussalsi]
MSPSFDLATRGFCEVRWLRDPPEGIEPDEPVNLRTLLLHAHDIADVEVSPPPTLAGFLRILTVLAGRITALAPPDATDQYEDIEDWQQARERHWHAGRFDPDAVERYFAEHVGRFELFHTATPEGAPLFLQDHRLLEQCRTTKGESASSGVNKLVLGRAAGQAFVWHSHTTDREPPSVTAPEAFWALLSWLFYGVPGRCTPRRVGETNAADTKAGPLRDSVSFHPVGRSLFETLLASVPYYDPCENDRAPWEEPPPDPLAVPPRPEGLARVLTGRFRHALLLSPTADGEAVEDARITWAWRREHGQVDDPHVLYQYSGSDEKLTKQPRSATADRAVWRDLDVLTGAFDSEQWDDQRRQRPAVFGLLDDLVEDEPEPPVTRVRVLGFDQDRSQAKDRQYFAGSTPALLDTWRCRDEHRWVRLVRTRQAAEYTGGTLERALAAAWREIVGRTDPKKRGNGVPWTQPAMARYWADAEQEFHREFGEAATASDEPVANRFIRRARQAFSEVTEPYERRPSDIAVLERHRAQLSKGWRSSNGGQDS